MFEEADKHNSSYPNCVGSELFVSVSHLMMHTKPYTVKKINLIQIGYLEFRTNLRSFRVIILVFRTISHYLNSKTEFGPGLEQFQQIRTILRFLDPI